MTKADRKLLIMRYLGYEPTAGQLPIHQSAARLRLVAGGERGGKSRSGSIDVISEAVDEAKRKRGLILVWLVGDRYEDARAEFDYIIQDLQRLGVLASLSYPQKGPCTALARWNGGAIQVETKSARDAKSLRSKAPHLVLVCEAATISLDAYLRLHGRVSQHNGKILLTGTFEEAYGWYPELFTEWQARGAEGVSFSLPSWSNTYWYPGGIDDPKIDDLRRQYASIPGLFDARCGGVPTPPVGLVFREFSHKVHIDAERAAYVPGSPVYLCVDPSRGTNPYAVVACQTRLGDQVHVIDEVYEVGRICEEVIEIAQEREWWGDVVKGAWGGAIGHDAPDDKKRWRKFGGVSLQTKLIKEEHLIRRLQSFLHYEDGGEPSIFVHPRCRGGIREFGLWRRNDNNKPIDRDNHWLKAVGYWLINKFGFVVELPRPRRVRTDYAGTAVQAREW